MKVLLLYGSFGDGHVQAANALAQVFETRYKAEVIKLDCFRQTNPQFARANEWLYETLTRYLPHVYGASYDFTRTLSPKHPLWSLLAHFSRRATWHALLEHQPDIVVQLFPDHALARLPRFLAVKPLIVTVLTDFEIHSRWFHANVDLYLLPTTWTLQRSTRFMSPASTASVAGIPIREQFSACRLNQVMDGAYIVLAAGGRGVFPDLSAVLKQLLQYFATHRVVVLCGRNERMSAVVEEIGEKLNVKERLCALGYTEQIATWFQQATFVITKAGGISAAECLASGVPLIFYKPQPGQEQKNAVAIEKMGAARVAKNLHHLAEVLDGMTNTVLAQMREASIAHGHPVAAQAGAREIVDMWKRMKH
jgi:processive 1,2-diacylglycerol beta-glucosyltransferase